MSRRPSSGLHVPLVWGATEDEVAARYPCDDLAPRPDVALWRAVDVAAPAPLVYRWVQQLRIAPYSYDLLDNFALPSPRRLTPRADVLSVGQRIMHVFRVAAFVPGRTLTVGPGPRFTVALAGALHGTYAVTVRGAGARLVVKVCCNVADTWYGRLYARALPWLDLIMMRKQLLTLRAYAERDARAYGAQSTLAANVSAKAMRCDGERGAG